MKGVATTRVVRRVLLRSWHDAALPSDPRINSTPARVG
jgi:hypothetical protein